MYYIKLLTNGKYNVLIYEVKINYKYTFRSFIYKNIIIVSYTCSEEINENNFTKDKNLYTDWIINILYEPIEDIDYIIKNFNTFNTIFNNYEYIKINIPIFIRKINYEKCNVEIYNSYIPMLKSYISK